MSRKHARRVGWAISSGRVNLGLWPPGLQRGILIEGIWASNCSLKNQHLICVFVKGNMQLYQITKSGIQLLWVSREGWV